MASEDEDGTKGNRKRIPVWSIVKNASFVITASFFILCIVLSLDAYKFISVRQAKYARKKLLTGLQYMDPSIIEAHTGMKVLTKAESANLTSTLDAGRLKVREARIELSRVSNEYEKIAREVDTMKAESEEMKKIIAEKEAEAKAAVPAVVAKPAVPAAVNATGDAAVNATGDAAAVPKA
ncbi:hypothetical protein ACHAXA_001809 [Cyclostephanos tholiformis]|uniref:Uncharacterized protein n=1 Tax=Cyclostephanos tholiformis TaxID=382380 RepID=A0ABD3SE20_9STRA